MTEDGQRRRRHAPHAAGHSLASAHVRFAGLSRPSSRRLRRGGAGRGAVARLFLDGLGCRNALFLEGSVSSLYAPELKRDDEAEPIGPIVGVMRAGGGG